METKQRHNRSLRARFLSVQPILWLSIASVLLLYLCMFFWYLDSFYGTVISAAALAYAFIKLKGSFSYARNRAKMYDLFSMAIRSVGYEETSLVIAKYMDTICGMFIARMILKDTGNLDKWDNLKKKAKLARKTKRLTKPKL